MINCIYCNSKKIIKFKEVKDRFSKEIFIYNKCTNCGLVFLDSIPLEKDILKYYPDNYEAYQLINDDKVLDKKIKLISRLCAQCSSILDIGCSNGSFLISAKENNFEHIFGIELNTQIAKIASDRGVEIIGRTLDDASKTGMTFDVITLWDVFEHLPDPINALKKTFIMLNQDGFLFLSIPNLNSFDRFLFGKNWIGWDAPRHFYLFDQKLMRILLSDVGFTNIQLFGITGAKGAFNLSIDKLLNCEISKTKTFSLFSLLLWPYRQIGYLFNKCPVITIAAKKRIL